VREKEKAKGRGGRKSDKGVGKREGRERGERGGETKKEDVFLG
jgi:hypothetical protein